MSAHNTNFENCKIHPFETCKGHFRISGFIRYLQRFRLGPLSLLDYMAVGTNSIQLADSSTLIVSRICISKIKRLSTYLLTQSFSTDNNPCPKCFLVKLI